MTFKLKLYFCCALNSSGECEENELVKTIKIGNYVDKSVLPIPEVGVWV